MSDLTPARILHVDDEQAPLRETEEFFEKEDLGGWGPPAITGVTDFDTALTELERVRYDLVVLDVRAGGHEPADLSGPDEEEAGRVVLKQIQDRRYVPVIFYTGLESAVEGLATPSVRVVAKSSGAESLVAEARALFETRLPMVNRALLRFVEEQQREYMWNFVSDNWSDLAVDGDHSAIAFLLARRIGRSLTAPVLSELAQTIGEAPSSISSTVRAHPMELYVLPPLEGPFSLGDLFHGSVEGQPGWWLLMSPSCDLQPGRINAERVLLARADLLDQHPKFKGWEKDEPPSVGLKELLSNKTGGKADRNLFLPRAVTVPDLLVDFQQMHSTPLATLATLDHVATLESPFAEAALNRFERYYGRVGVQDLDIDAAIERMRSPSQA